MRRLAILKWQWNRPRSDWPQWIDNPPPSGTRLSGPCRARWR
ncbi:hypothetical protein RAA17_04505 [Komagataeibacter rhaeticus]|nr:hypothetical protein [Komagataeibacter rhaeticus]